ncbi:conjugal transfer protein TraF [Kaarinaea lacus]
MTGISFSVKKQNILPMFSAYKKLFASLMLAAITGNSHALEYPVFDARSAGLGGVNVAHGISNAALYNPALAALEPEGFDWYFVAPGAGEFEADPDNIKDTLEGTGNIADIDGKEYFKNAYKNLLMTIPSPGLGGSLYVMEYETQTAKVITDNTGTNLVHRSIEVSEIGFGIAQLQDILWMERILVGITGKISLLKSYGYSEPIATASLDLDNDQALRDSELNLDIGFSKEYGVWKTGLVFKNIFSQENDLGSSGDTYSLGPQIRGGIAYQSRRAMVELDVDLMKNDGIGYAPDTLLAALGWEWRVFHAFMLRLGYTQNLIGDNEATYSAGIGLKMWALQIDGAFIGGENGEGAYAQAAWEF